MDSVISWWKTISEEGKSRYSKDLGELILFFSGACIVYFAKIVTDLPNPDAIWNGMFFKSNCGWEISLGRYMLGVLQVFRAYTINTTFITLVCMAMLSFICVYTLKIFEIKTLGWKIIVGALIIISPTVGSTLTYYYCSDFYMISYFLAVLAVWFMVGEGKARLLVASICLMLSAAIYQAYISLAILLCFIYLMKMLLDSEQDGKKVFKKAGRCLVSGIAGVGLYLMSNKVVQQICKIDAQRSRGFSEMGMLDFDSIFVQIGQCYSSFKQYYFQDSMINNLCYFRKEINILFFFLLGCLFLGILLKSEIVIGRKLMFIGMCLLYPVISLSICILAPKISIFDSTGVLMLPTMNYIYVLAVILFQLLDIRELYQKICAAGVFIATAAVFIMLLQLELGGQSYMKYNMLKTYHVAGQIEERANGYGKAAAKLCVIGSMESGNYPDNYSELAESQHWVSAGYKTIWSDYDGCQHCWHEFMKQYLGKAYDMCSKEEYIDITQSPEYSAMGIFPEQNGAILIHDTVVIKLSDPIW